MRIFNKICLGVVALCAITQIVFGVLYLIGIINWQQELVILPTNVNMFLGAMYAIVDLSILAIKDNKKEDK